ncbi:hypothetical protein HK096_010173 [Nowakowskiella sp. JEL0078]|nr:hypothetical protein HK096_010173 [Nowakowskiella sp. JEL0078]
MNNNSGLSSYIIYVFVVEGALIVFMLGIWHLFLKKFMTSRGMIPTDERTIPLTAVRNKEPIVLSINQVNHIKSYLYLEFHRSPPSQEKHSLEVNNNSMTTDDEQTCSICLEDFKDDEYIRILDTCNHIFHKHCIDNWLVKQATYCPNCRLDTRIALGISIDPKPSEENNDPLLNEDSVAQENNDQANSDAPEIVITNSLSVESNNLDSNQHLDEIHDIP